MQNYTEISENQTLRDSRSLLLNNDKTAMSNSSGESFPTQNLQIGMFCFRTDEKKLYQLMDNMPTWKLVLDMSGDGAKVAQAESVEANGVTTDAIANQAVSGEKLADNVIASKHIEDSAVIENKIADHAVSTDKIALRAVTCKQIDMDDLRGNLGASYVINNVAAAPHYYERSEVPSASDKTVLAMPEILWLNVANKGYSVDGAVTIDLLNADMWDNSAYITASNRKGKDFYIYACVTSNDTLRYILSANSTVPTGYTASTSRKIGGFHCLCADVGSITGHTLSGYVAGDILPYSVWDLKHRPKSEPEGMVYVPGIDLWVDIYLASWTGTTAAGTLKAVSKYGATTGDGASTEKFHCWKWEQTMGEQKKRLLYQREFMVASVGSNQGTNVKGSADVNTTGGFSDTAGRRMISNYGIEDMCGNLWQWGADVGSATTGSSSYGNGYDANDRSDIKGQTYGGVYRPLLGGSWANGAVCGSRGSRWDRGSLGLDATYGGRGASEPLGA